MIIIVLFRAFVLEQTSLVVNVSQKGAELEFIFAQDGTNKSGIKYFVNYMKKIDNSYQLSIKNN